MIELSSTLLLVILLVLLIVVFVCAGLLFANVLSVRKRFAEQNNQLSLEKQASCNLREQVGSIEDRYRELVEKHEYAIELNRDLEKQLVASNTELTKERESFEARLKDLTRAEANLKATFESLSSQALKSNNSAFLELANSTFDKLKAQAKGELELKEKAVENLVQPIREGIKQFDTRIEEMEKGRTVQMSNLSDLVKDLSSANEKMRVETNNLVSALRAPNIRGQWGELQLKRTIELAGMVKYCDFVEQTKIGGDDVNLRPDVVVRLPNHRKVIIDSKAPLTAYLEASETDDMKAREMSLKRHAKHLRDHLKRLGQKAYHDHLEDSPEFVVMFLPGEVFYSAALEQDPGLIEYGVDQKVLIATPTTLIALLKAIAYGWKNQEIAEKAGEISKAGKDLYESIIVMLGHMNSVRRHLGQTVDAFNKTIRSTDTRLLPRVNKFKNLNAGTDKDLPNIEPLETRMESITYVEE